MPSLTHSLFVTVLVFSCFLSPSFCDGVIELSACNRTFSCGPISNVSYPFTGGDRPDHCGIPEFKLNCQPNNVTEFTHNSVTYRVLQLNQTTKSLTLSRSDLYENVCPSHFANSTLNSTLFSFGDLDNDLNLIYGCNATTAELRMRPQNLFSCTIENISFTDAYYIVGPVPSDPILRVIYCSVIVTVPILRSVAIRLSHNMTSLGRALMEGFTVNFTDPYQKMCVDCNGLGGQCGFDASLGEPICICGNGPCPVLFAPPPDVNASSTPEGDSSSNSPLRIALPIAGAVIAGVGLGWLIFFCRQRRKRLAADSSQVAQTESKLQAIPLASKAPSTPPSDAFTKSIPSFPSSKSEFGRESSYYGVPVFSYDELEEATDNFSQSRELGDGGFGAVYYGVLRDGRIVAVKRLYENNFKRVEQFINEVEILTRLRHSNLVTLYGCTSKRSRELLLVYEYIPNGTVADHLHGKRSNSGLLSWPIRLNIAIETADALTYLHASDIIHRDVKTTNVLLDNDFHVKVADFGLSRLFPTDVTHVSTAPQGTPGYVDPEYYQCYQLTEKSDVYSFGVVLIELISSLQAVDTNRHRLDINLANMAINKIQNHTLNELVDPTLDFGTNSSVRRMATQVAELAFRCLQQERDMRPSMQEVLDSLRKIQNEGFNAQKDEVVDILIDDGGIVKDNVSPSSPDSATDKWISSSATNSSG